MTRRSVTPFFSLALLMATAAPAIVAQEPGSAPVRPQLTELVRAGLQAPQDSAVWGEMAALLPELARSGEASVMEAFEAGRVADSLSRAPVDPMALALETGRRSAERNRVANGGGPAPVAELPSTELSAQEPSSADLSAGVGSGLTLDAGTALWVLPWVAVALLGLATAVVKARRAGRLKLRRGGPTSAPRKAPASADRMWAVTTLAESGLPPSEIARRTGMAQDAVQVLMGMRGVGSSGASRTSSGTFGRPATIGERAAGVSAERTALLRQARRMKDRRITYGPGAGR